MNDARSNDLLKDEDVDADTAAIIDEITSPLEAPGEADDTPRQSYDDAESEHATYDEAEAAARTYDEAESNVRSLGAVCREAGTIGNIGAGGESLGNLGGEAA